jgi:hypothetical protein
MFNIFVYAVSSSLCLRDSERLLRLNGILHMGRPADQRSSHRTPHTNEVDTAPSESCEKCLRIHSFLSSSSTNNIDIYIYIYIYHELMFSASGIRTRSSIAGNTALLLRVLLIVITFHGSHGIENLQKLVSLRIRCHCSRQSKFHFKLKIKLIPVAPNESQDTATL